MQKAVDDKEEENEAINNAVKREKHCFEGDTCSTF
jgi:hypothetical protein